MFVPQKSRFAFFKIGNIKSKVYLPNAVLQQNQRHTAMKLKRFIVISASLATVGLLGAVPSAFSSSLEPQTNIKEVQPLVRDVENYKGAAFQWNQNQGLVLQDEATKSIQSLPVAVAMLPTQSNQPRFAEQTARYINTFGGVFLPCVFIGYILGELWSIKSRVKRMAVQHSRVIGVFPDREAAGQALDQLVLSGFLLKQVFLVGKDLALNEQFVDALTMSALINQVRADAISGIATGLRNGFAIGKVSGGFIGLLLGLGILALLGVNQIALTPAVGFTLICGGICTAVGGIIGALIGLRITKKQVREYGERIARGDYLLIVKGTKDEIEQAKRILNTSDFFINSWAI